MYTAKPLSKVLTRGRLFAAVLILAIGVIGAVMPGKGHAACVTPSADFGSVTTTLAIPSTTTYRIWTRMFAPNASSSSYMLQVDGNNTCYIVGGANVPANAWTWVDYQDNTVTSKVEQSLAQGNHSLKMVGLSAGVKIDRIFATSDLSCVPMDAAGTQCNQPSDQTPPTVTMTAPAEGATITGPTTITATATDNVAVTKVNFYVNNSLVGTDTTAPYSYNWDPSLLANGDYTLQVNSYDAAGHVSPTPDSHKVTVKIGDKQAPTVPAGVTATANAYNKVTVGWKASTDNIAVSSYNVLRNGVSVGQVTSPTTTFTDNNVMASTSYSYTVTAMDPSGNVSGPSSAAVVTTPAMPVPVSTDHQAPSSPQNLNLVVVSPSQINLSWTASTDNLGVTGYEVWRQTGVGPDTKIATVTTTSFGDTTLKAYTKYYYYVKARDAAGNVSIRSLIEYATTRSTDNGSELLGTIRNSGGQGIAYAKLSFIINGVTHTYTADSHGQYDIEGLSGGTYLLTYTAPGYKPFLVQRIITANARVAQFATLQKQ